jgi:hypothetical protein
LTTLLQVPLGGQFKRFEIPDGVQVVSSYSFSECYSLEEVSFPQSLTEIGLGAFEKCVCLKGILLPQNVVAINSHSFVDCESIKSISFSVGSCLRSIGDFAFSGCRSLRLIDFPDSLKTIGAHSFSFCTALTKVRFPEALVTLGPFAFAKCVALQAISLPDGLAAVESHAFSGCLSVKSLTFPDRSRVARIGAAAFASLSNLTHLVLPESVTFLDEFAFSGCKSLVHLVLPNGLEVIHYYAFWGCKALAGSLSIPSSVKAVDLRAFGRTALRKIVLTNCAVRFDNDSLPPSVRAVVAPAECEGKFRGFSAKRRRGGRGVVWAILLFMVALATWGWNVGWSKAKKDVPMNNDHVPLIARPTGFY